MPLEAVHPVDDDGIDASLPLRSTRPSCDMDSELGVYPSALKVWCGVPPCFVSISSVLGIPRTAAISSAIALEPLFSQKWLHSLPARLQSWVALM